jgi:hypothetical protein
MTKQQLGKYLLTLVLAAQAVMGFLLDWKSNHLLSPEWHPHARFHGGLLLLLLAGVSATGLWLLWRESKEPGVALKAAAFISLSFWTPFLYVGAVVPGATPWAGLADSAPHIAGYVFYPNIAVAVLFQIVTVFAWRLTREHRTTTAADPTTTRA